MFKKTIIFSCLVSIFHAQAMAPHVSQVTPAQEFACAFALWSLGMYGSSLTDPLFTPQPMERTSAFSPFLPPVSAAPAPAHETPAFTSLSEEEENFLATVVLLSCLSTGRCQTFVRNTLGKEPDDLFLSKLPMSITKRVWGGTSTLAQPWLDVIIKPGPKNLDIFMESTGLTIEQITMDLCNQTDAACVKQFFRLITPDQITKFTRYMPEIHAKRITELLSQKRTTKPKTAQKPALKVDTRAPVVWHPCRARRSPDHVRVDTAATAPCTTLQSDFSPALLPAAAPLPSPAPSTAFTFLSPERGRTFMPMVPSPAEHLTATRAPDASLSPAGPSSSSPAFVFTHAQEDAETSESTTPTCPTPSMDEADAAAHMSPASATDDGAMLETRAVPARRPMLARRAKRSSPGDTGSTESLVRTKSTRTKRITYKQRNEEAVAHIKTMHTHDAINAADKYLQTLTQETHVDDFMLKLRHADIGKYIDINRVIFGGLPRKMVADSEDEEEMMDTDSMEGAAAPSSHTPSVSLKEYVKRRALIRVVPPKKRFRMVSH